MVNDETFEGGDRGARPGRVEAGESGLGAPSDLRRFPRVGARAVSWRGFVYRAKS